MIQYEIVFMEVLSACLSLIIVKQNALSAAVN